MRKPARTRSGATPAPTPDDSRLELVNRKDGPRVDSRDLAQHLNKQRHQDLFELVKRYEVKLLKLGKLLFETGASTGSKTGQRERFALLNEDQAYFVLTLSRNTERTVDLKLKLIQAFAEARRAAQMRAIEYLPGYHELHGQIDVLAAGSENSGRVHMNFNKLLNKVAGIEAGTRSSAPPPKQSLLIVAQAIATEVVKQAPDHHAGYQQTKVALGHLSCMVTLGTTQPSRITRA